MNKNFLALIGLLLVFCQFTFAQERTVSGVVKADDGEPLPGATVQIKGTTTGTSTDANGKYSIKVPNNDAVLVVKFIGMEDTEMPVGSNANVDVAMKSGVTLQEVIVDALGFERPKDESGVASTTLGGEQIENSGDVRLINSIAGKSAGVNITSSTGDPGAGSRIQIRGATSITGDLEPLIVIDGIPMFNDSYYGEGFGGNLAGSGGSLGSGGGVTQQSRLNDLNSDDIENVEILRGASAAAIWGSRAANGVIIITTKKGKLSKSGKTFNVDITASVALDQVNRQVPLQEKFGNGVGQQYVQGTPLSWGDKIENRTGGADNDIRDPNDPAYAGYFAANSGTRYYSVPSGTAAAAGDLALVHGGKNDKTLYDPYEMLFKTGVTRNLNVGVTSADEKGSVYFSVGDMYQDGVIKENSTYRRNTARLNLTRYLGEKFTLSGNMGYTRTESDRVQMGSNLNGLFLGGLRSASDFNDEDYEGTYVSPDGVSFENRQRAYRNPLGANLNSIYDNPLWMMNNILSDSRVNRFIGKLEGEYEALDWLNIIWRTGTDYYVDEREDFFPSLSAGENNGGRFTKETITRTQINNDIMARVKFQLNENIGLNGLVGNNINHRKLDDHAATIRQFINPLAPANLENGVNVFTNDYATVNRTVGWYTSWDAQFYDQLFVSATARLDYLSTLPTENNSVFYPAFNAAWHFTKLINENDWLTFGKLRAGWGQVGRGPDPYITRTTFFAPQASNTGWGEGWGPGLDPSVYGGGFAQNAIAGNPDIGPEIKTEIELGVDLRFVKDRGNLSFTYYNNTTKDLILQVDVAESSGFVSQVANAAEIQNTGIEIEAGYDVYKTDDWRVNVYGNYTTNQNEVVDMSGTTSFLLSGFSGTSSRAVVGEQLGVLWGAKWDRDGSGNLILDDNGFPTIAAEAGILGDPNPDFRAGFGSLISYKNWSFNVLFDMAQGIDMWNGTKGALAFFGRAEYQDVETTLSAAQAGTLLTYGGATVADAYPYLQNSDGSYTVRGKIENFGGGDVFLDETYYYVGPGSGFTGPDEQFVEDASWTRLREMSLTYNFTGDKLKELTRLQGASLTFTARNLFLWTDYDGNDPDQNLVGSGNNGQGLDYFQNPSTRTYQFTLKLNI